MSYDEHRVALLATDHEHPTVRRLALQLSALHEAVSAHLDLHGLADLTGPEATQDALIVAHREWQGLCPECADNPGHGDDCETCASYLLDVAADMAVEYDLERRAQAE